MILPRHCTSDICTGTAWSKSRTLKTKFYEKTQQMNKIFRVRTGPGNPGKTLEIFFIKPWKISQNFIEKINSQNDAFC